MILRQGNRGRIRTRREQKRRAQADVSVFESSKDTFYLLIEKQFGEDGKDSKGEHVSKVNSLCVGAGMGGENERT